MLISPIFWTHRGERPFLPPVITVQTTLYPLPPLSGYSWITPIISLSYPYYCRELPSHCPASTSPCPDTWIYWPISVVSLPKNVSSALCICYNIFTFCNLYAPSQNLSVLSYDMCTHGCYNFVPQPLNRRCSANFTTWNIPAVYQGLLISLSTPPWELHVLQGFGGGDRIFYAPPPPPLAMDAAPLIPSHSHFIGVPPLKPVPSWPHTSNNSPFLASSPCRYPSPLLPATCRQPLPACPTSTLECILWIPF